MRPPPFRPRPGAGDGPYVVDHETGLLWHRIEHRPLYADTDRSGTVYHAHYLRYFEIGRATLMRESGCPYSSIEAAGYTYPVVDTRLGYFAPLAYDQAFVIHTRPAALEKVRVRFDYVLTLGDGADVCRGFTLHCALDARRRVVAVDPGTAALVRDWQRREAGLGPTSR